MSKAAKITLGLLIAALLLALVVFFVVPSLHAASGSEPEPTEEAPTIRHGLTEENGALYYYNEDGTLFTDGYKEIDGNYYFFQADGTAFTGGALEVSLDEERYTYFFQADGTALTCGWENINEQAHYFQANGQAAVDTFLTIDGSLYHFDAAGAVTTGGWFCVGDGYYYADEAGILATNTVVEGYRLDETGRSATKSRIIQYVNEHTDDSMTQQEKIEALYDWVLNSDLTYIRSFEHTKADWVWEDGWVDDMAASLMDEWGGNCYRYAAFLGMLLHEATGLPVNVCRGQTPGVTVDLTFHGWCEVYQDGIWYIYDVELLKFTEYTREGCYQIPAAESNLHIDGTPTPLYSGELPADSQ